MTHRTLIIATSQRDLCASLCETLAGPAGSGMFTTALYTGDTLTHYISAGEISDEFAGLLPFTERDDEGGEMTALGDAQAIAYLAGQSGVVVTVAQVEAMLAAADVSQIDPFQRMAHMGLSMTQPHIEEEV